MRIVLALLGGLVVGFVLAHDRRKPSADLVKLSNGMYYDATIMDTYRTWP